MSLPRLNSVESHPIRLKENSITSSLNSVYDQYERHINVLKWTGLIILLGLAGSTLGISSNLYQFEKSHAYGKDCIQIRNKVDVHNFNNTVCSYIKRFQLPAGYIATVCRQDGITVIDIRMFINNKPTIRGIPLSADQWKYLLSLKGHIDRAIQIANGKEP